ncbi:MAG: hypothetical protein ABIZ49_11180 [Opitutaceae bacterium]
MNRQTIAILFLTAVRIFAADSEEDESRAYAAGISRLTTRVESFVADEIVHKLGRCEYPPARRYAIRDLDGDKKDDVLLITTFTLVSGGNYHESHLFVALSSQSTVQHLIVGGRGKREADRFQEGSLALFLQFRVWASSDPQCCPSLKTSEEIRIENGRLALKPFDEIRR